MFDSSTLSTWGLPGLFLSTLLSGAIIPLPSDAVLVGLVAYGHPALSAVIVATVGNTLGACSLYWMGSLIDAGGGGRFGRFIRARLAKDPAGADRARQRLARWGAPALLLSWIPGIGDALVLASGVVGVRTGPFLAFVIVGKASRYALIAYVTASAIS